jgi:succinyl-CoA synthetase alpha subunit
MSILINNNTKLIVQGMTGREGTFHARLMKKYGTNVVAGVTPGKEGTFVDDIPVFDTVLEAKTESDANTSILFVPPRFTRDAILEACEAGIELIVTIAEGVPLQDMLFCANYCQKANSKLIGPNTPGIISPGKAKVGFMADMIYSKGPIGIMSRSATLSYETANNLTNEGIGQSTVVGVGGDPICGSTFLDLLPLFEQDEQTKAIIIVGEIGGNNEEIAAEYARGNISKPLVAFIAGEAAPEGKRMGHAGAIVSPGGGGGARKKKDDLRANGVTVVEKLTEIPKVIRSILSYLE